MKSRAALQKINAVLIDTTIFAYASIPLNFLLYGIITKILGHAYGDNLLSSYFLPNLSLSAIFWAVNFFAFLFPVPTICFLIWNLYRYCFLVDAHTQHLNLIVGYVLAVVTALLLRTIWRKVLHFSPGSSLCNAVHLSANATTAKERVFNGIFSTFIASELVELLRPILFKRQLPSDNSSSNEISTTTRNEMASVNEKMLPISLVMLSMFVGLVLSSLWKLPLREYARQIEHNLPSAVKPSSREVPVVLVCMKWLYAGDGVRAIELAESQIHKELKSTKPSSQTRISELVSVIYLADRAGYCDSSRWQQISQLLSGTLSSPFEDSLAFHLQNGDERHGLYSQATKIDNLRLTATLKTYGQNSTKYIDRLHQSAIFHMRIKDHAQAIKQFTLLIDLCETNINSSNFSDKEFFTQIASDSKRRLMNLKSE